MIVATSGDMKQLYNIPSAVRTEIENTVRILDTSYGEDRDIFHGMGGFVFVAQDIDDVCYLLNEWRIDLASDTTESVRAIGEYIFKLFILNSDFAIRVVYKEELLWRL